MANPDLFDAYFRRADTDRDGRISGIEAVTFFQGANLNREVLAKIWQYADQGQTGFLSRPEFYNALKLVTVAQTGRDLNPAIVQRALQGPAASQIPPPQIQLPPGPLPAAQPAGIVRPVRPSGPGGGLPPQQYQQYATGPPPAGQYMPTGPRPNAPTAQPRTAASPATGASTVSSATEWPTNKSSSWPGPSPPTSNNNIAGQNFQVKPSPVPPSQVPQDAFGGSGPKSSSIGSAGQSGSDLFGGDVFTAIPVKPPVVSAQSQPNLTGIAQTPQRVGQTAIRTNPSLALVPTSVAPAAASNQLQTVAQQAVHTRPDARGQGFGASPGVNVGNQWPKLTDLVVQRYTKVFMEVDTDKDGKITGDQARDLFLSWRLPREALKQIWDLSDQDHDSMLSLREFCTALYLMERFREGRTLPPVLPSAFYFDESAVAALRIAEAQVAVAQNSAGYNVPAWQQNPSAVQAPGHVMPGLPPRPVQQATVPGQISSQVQATVGDGFDSSRVVQPKSKAPVLEMNLVNQLNADDQLTLQTKHQDAVDAEKKVQELEKQIMDSKEKMEFYRTKLQDIVLFKTRCDNRLAEITERAAADKREVESFAKRYDEKFKQAGESQSRLLIDEAAFRDVQERKLELYNAIVRMEQGGDTNALLQSRADRIQSDLDELRKTLNAKCKQLHLRIKPTALIELPYGWQPGIQENAAQWDEDWDKFDDEGFVFVQDFMDEATTGSFAGKPNAAASWDDNGPVEDGFDFSSADADEKLQPDSPSSKHHGGTSSQADSDDGLVRNGDGSPHHEMSPSSPGHDGNGIFGNSNASTKEAQSHDQRPSSSNSGGDVFGDNGGDWASVFSHRSDDMDSDVHASWGLSNPSSTKASLDNSSQAGKSNKSAVSFGFGDSFDMLSSPARVKENDLREDFPSFGPIRTKDKASFSFDNSVPSTPLFNNASPARSSNAGPLDNHLPSQDHFARFDSFSSNIHDSAPAGDSFARFDSFSSVQDAAPPRGFTSFDDSDPFAGTGPFGGGRTPRHTADAWSAFS